MTYPNYKEKHQTKHFNKLRKFAEPTSPPFYFKIVGVSHVQKWKQLGLPEEFHTMCTDSDKWAANFDLSKKYCKAKKTILEIHKEICKCQIKFCLLPKTTLTHTLVDNDGVYDSFCTEMTQVYQITCKNIDVLSFQLELELGDKAVCS